MWAGKTDHRQSVARIVSEAVVGKSATDALAGTTEDMKELKDKAGETVSAIGEAVGGADSKLNGVSNFLREASGGGLFNMLSGFCETSEEAMCRG